MAFGHDDSACILGSSDESRKFKRAENRIRAAMRGFAFKNCAHAAINRKKLQTAVLLGRTPKSEHPIEIEKRFRLRNRGVDHGSCRSKHFGGFIQTAEPFPTVTMSRGRSRFHGLKPFRASRAVVLTLSNKSILIFRREKMIKSFVGMTRNAPCRMLTIDERKPGMNGTLNFFMFGLRQPFERYGLKSKPVNLNA